MIEKVLYTGLVDISLPDGPGINERGFLGDMLSRFGSGLSAVIPNPSRGIPESLSSLDIDVIPARGSVRSRIGWIQTRALGWRILAKRIEAFAPNIIVMRTGAVPVPHFMAAKKTKIPYVIKTAGDASHRGFYDANPWRRGLQSVNRTLFDKVVNNAWCIDVVSEAQRATMIRLYPTLASRLAVIDNGVDLDHFPPRDIRDDRMWIGFESSDIVIGYVGGFPMRRGGKEIVDAVATLCPVVPVKGLVVGDSGEAEALRRYAAQRRVTDRVVVYGEADFGEVPKLMSSMDVGLSILRPQERGASEQKVRQYLATGLCVIGTAGSNDFLRHKEFARVIDTHERETVLGAVKHFARKDRETLSKLGDAARTFAESNLASSARNDERIALWTRALAASSEGRS